MSFGDDTEFGERDGDLAGVALGDEAADLVVTGGRVLLPDGTLRERDVAVVGDRIAAVPGDATRVVGPETRQIDATDRTVVPGFVDAHDHVDVNQPIERWYHERLARGTTSVITEASSIVSTPGPVGVEALLEATDPLSLGVFVTLPPQPFVDTFEDPGWSDRERARLLELLDHERVIGVGETDWIHVVGRSAPDLRECYHRAREAGGRIVGHGAGCRGEKLTAFAGVVDNDHEPTSVDGVQARLASGLHVVGRRGSIRDDLDAIAGAERPRGDVSLCTDGTWPQDDAGMDDVLRELIGLGVDLAEAVELATRNPAAHFGLRDRGTVAPGKRADLVVCTDLERVAVETVVAGGEVVVDDGEPLVGPHPYDYPDPITDSVHVDLGPKSLTVPETSGRDGTVRAIRSDRGLVTRETTVEPPVEDGAFVADPDEGILKAALFDRRPDHDDRFVGFVTGLGIDRGAAATTVTWEQPGLLAVGTSDAAIERAVERLVSVDGGWVVVDDDPREGPTVRSTLPMSIAGVMADRSRESIAEAFGEIDAALVALGADPDPGFPRASEGYPGTILALQTLAFPGVPVLRMSFSGYVNVLDRSIVGR